MIFYLTVVLLAHLVVDFAIVRSRAPREDKRSWGIIAYSVAILVALGFLVHLELVWWQWMVLVGTHGGACYIQRDSLDGRSS
jgi:cyanate permease